MEITDAKFVISNSDYRRCPQDGRHEYAFIGRSNVGKSSLINMLAKRKKLAMTSSTPGKTMLINHFLVNNEWYIVDLPGYGYARRSKVDRANFEKLISDYVLHRPQLTNLFVLVDSRLEPQKVDLAFINWLGENGVPFSIVFTKVDKLKKKGKVDENVEKYLQTLREEWEELPPYFVTSAEKGIGREELLDYIAHVNEENPVDVKSF